MARSDPDKLAQALRANLRRRKAAPPPVPPSEAPESPESFPKKPPDGQG